MRPAGTPLPPIPPAARWAGRTVAWVAWAGMLALEAPRGMAPFPVSPAGLALLTVAIALDTHRWLPSQNTVASAILVALGGGAVTAALGSASRPALALSALLDSATSCAPGAWCASSSGAAGVDRATALPCWRAPRRWRPCRW